MNAAPLLLFGVAGLLGTGSFAWQRRHQMRLIEAGLRRRLAALSAGPEDFLLPPPPLPEIGAALPRRVAVALARADVPPRRDVTLLLLALTGSGAAVAFLLFGVAAACGVAAVGVLGPAVVVRILGAKRIGRFTAALPSLFDSTRQLMVAGSSLQQALLKAIADGDEDVRRYLRPLELRLANGAPVADSIALIADRLENRELFILAVAVRANIRHGGRMAPMLANVATVLRDQARIVREMRSASAETRWSGYLIGSFPPLCAAYTTWGNAAAIQFFLHDTTGQWMLAAAAIFEIFGIIAMRRVMKVEL